MEFKTIKHLNPVWREKANFIIGARCTYKNHATKAWEQLWSRKISDNYYEICCIPFFLYDISLGDEVKTDRDYWILKVTKRAGHFTFRVWFGNSDNSMVEKDLIDKINNLGGLFEWYSSILIAIDTPNEYLARQLSDYLFEKEQLGWFTYETGKT
jgi:hypothetical protein